MGVGRLPRCRWPGPVPRSPSSPAGGGPRTLHFHLGPEGWSLSAFGKGFRGVCVCICPRRGHGPVGWTTCRGSDTLGRRHRWDMTGLGTQRKEQGPWERRPRTGVWGGGPEGQGAFCGAQMREAALGGAGGRGGQKPPTPEPLLLTPSCGGTGTPALFVAHLCLAALLFRLAFRAAGSACGHSGRPGGLSKRQIISGSGLQPRPLTGAGAHLRTSCEMSATLPAGGVGPTPGSRSLHTALLSPPFPSTPLPTSLLLFLRPHLSLSLPPLFSSCIIPLHLFGAVHALGVSVAWFGGLLGGQGWGWAWGT